MTKQHVLAHMCILIGALVYGPHALGQTDGTGVARNDIAGDCFKSQIFIGMPPGWTAPYISVPNPIDVEEEFERNARKFPDEMRKMWQEGSSDFGNGEGQNGNFPNLAICKNQNMSCITILLKELKEFFKIQNKK